MAAKTDEALEARVEDLEEQVEDLTETNTELKDLYDRTKKSNKKLKQQVKEMKSQVSVLEDIEDELRDECLTVSKAAEELRKKEDRMTDEEQAELEEDLKSMNHPKLLKKLKALTRERDIVIEINKVNTDDPAGENDDPELPDENKPVQPFMARGELGSRYL